MKPSPFRPLASFTLVELLTVIAIIAILAGLTLSAFSGVMKSAARSRAHSEIAAISAALESYKSDNGTYPISNVVVGFASTNDYATSAPSTAGGSYQISSEFLYYMLTGQQSYGTLLPTGTKIYMTFKTSQLGNYQSGTTYIQDPFGNSYGYFSGTVGDTTDVPLNGQNQFDLWSTGGDISGASTGTNTWISNWGLGQ